MRDDIALRFGDGALHHERPPSFYIKIFPLRRLKHMKTQPKFNEPPKADGEAAIDEEVGDRFYSLLAKGT
jgi:hypothetical protein